jgi:hypothetical protein
MGDSEEQEDIFLKYKRTKEQKKVDMAFLEALLSTLVAENTLKSHAFFSIAFVPLAEYSDVMNNGQLVVIPIEVSLSKFSMEKGEIANLQRLINPIV